MCCLQGKGEMWLGIKNMRRSEWYFINDHKPGKRVFRVDRMVVCVCVCVNNEGGRITESLLHSYHQEEEEEDLHVN
jgi:hypothetical protein